ncbi:hypothetical protein P692DRAFT_201683590, partial [Suillus brevipes Sb2]
MSVFEPKTVLTLLKHSTAVSPLEKNTFEKKWRASLQWESEIVEYVQFLWEKTRSRSKKGDPGKLGINVPLLGPRFLPPSYLHVQKRSGGGTIEPTMQYLKPLNIVHPFYYPHLGHCPRCGSDKDTAWEGWTSKGARELHGLFCEEAALGTQLRCNRCKESSKAKTRGDAASGMVAGIEGYCFATTSAMYWKGWEHWRIPRESRAQQVVSDLMYSALRPSSTSAGLEELSRDTITEVFIEFSTHTRQIESANYLKSLSAICASLDNTFKAANKATLTNKDGQKTKEIKGGILTVLNEGNEIISWRFCQTRTNTEIAELLLGLKHRHDVLGLPQPKMVVADNCCHIRGAVASAMPETEAKLDVWHFTFEKWAEKGVWSAAAQKIHQEQLKHVRKGCLERSDQHLRSDGSRVEGTHKGWNSLQRAQPSGIVMLTALGHDFVLRRNIRVAFSRRQMTPFVEFTHGSHHIQLSNHVAKLYNGL